MKNEAVASTILLISTQKRIWSENSVSLVPYQCVLVNDFIEITKGKLLFDKIRKKAEWSQQTIKIFGKSVRSPRLSAWYGDKKAVYKYSGVINIPLPWFDELVQIRDMVESYTHHTFNSVLLNLYRDGSDSMGRHSDNETELGEEPVIASVSLGETRRFILHSKGKTNQRSIKFDLTHGALLIMSGKCQRNWKHSVPKTTSQGNPRISLTYRLVVPKLPL